jgi:putative hydrolase of the HAD superfamily
MKYKHIFFDLDHTLWDFDANSRLTLEELYHAYGLEKMGVHSFDLFHKNYLVHNEMLWARYRNGYIKVDELRWKRMWLTLIDFKIGDEQLAREMGGKFLKSLPDRKLLFPHAIEILEYLTNKKYLLHLITNGFEETQHSKLRSSGISKYFVEVITSEGSNSLKPHKEIFDYAFTRTRSKCHECIMVGDNIEADIIGAINAGMDQVYMNHLKLPVVDIQPTYIVHSLKELEEIF